MKIKRLKLNALSAEGLRQKEMNAINVRSVKTPISILLLPLVCSPNTFSQNKQGKVPYMTKSNIDKYITVDTATACVWYAFNAIDIQDEESYLDLQRLEIGKTRNKYYSHYVWESDSLLTVYQRHNHSGNYPSRLLPRGRGGKGRWSEMQYHTWFIQDGKVRTYTREPDSAYNGYYDEPYPSQQWSLTQDTATICSYHCQKATCHYHGRDFEAWFTTEIPMRFGPWKFGGLPGLIVKVYDTDRLYTFECVRVNNMRIPMLSNPYKQHRPINRAKVLKFERTVNEDYHRTLGWVRMEGPQPRPVHYEPLELE